jgi:signal transduction histidine kinase
LSTPLERFEGEYVDALERHLAERTEATLHAAYEIGRAALSEGLGVLDMAVIAHRALRSTCGHQRAGQEVEQTIEALESFVLESLSPFEMAYRGAREANSALRRQNEVLEAETTRIAHGLHDAAGQILAFAHHALDRLLSDAPQAVARVSEVRQRLDEVEDHLRQLSHELRPTILDDLGLVPALRFLGERVSGRSGIAVSIEESSVGRFPRPVEVTLYRVVQEALANAARHAQAAHVWIALRDQGGCVHCSIRDDGVGIPGQRDLGATPANHLGLAGIRDRVTSCGGSLVIESASKLGTELRVAIPVEADDAASHSAGR